jgi:hypothetical protein
MQPVQDRDQKLEESLVNRYEQNLTKLTDFYAQRAKKNNGSKMEIGTPHSFINLFLNIEEETQLYPLRMKIMLCSICQSK